MYTQNSEEQVILDYFGKTKLTVSPFRLLSVGENDGITFSNSRALIEAGWNAILVEPSPKAFKKLSELYKDSAYVFAIEAAIGTETGKMILHDSNEHCGAHGLLSTLIPDEKKRWEGSQTFEETEVQCYSWKDFHSIVGNPKFDFISIDAEGMDYDILSQMDLKALGCKMVVVEHNGKEIEKYIDYCSKLGMHELVRNAENLIMAI